MADSREMTFGLNFGLDETIGKLDDLVNRLEQSIDSMGAAEEAGREMGSEIQAGADTGAAGIREMTDGIWGAADEAGRAGDGIRDNLEDIEAGAEDMGDEFKATFRRMGADAWSFGQAVGKSMGTALKDGQSTAKGIQAGFEGAIGYTQKKVGNFVTSFKTGAKNIGTAFTHPIKTIKDKLGAALLSAADDAEKLGDSADDTRKDLEDMGDAGGDAGAQIKDALKGALTAMIGLEAIKTGIDKLKELGAAALEAAGAAESAGKKFDACFSGTDAGEWVENYASAVHRTTAEVQQFMVSNKAMYAEMGITGDAAAELSKITTSLAYDLGNAFSMDDGEALGVIQDYISGNTNALEEFGVHIDDVTLKAKAMEMGLGADIDALDDAAMAQVRMNALLDNSSKIQQAAVKDTGGLVNSTKSLQGVWGKFMADAGSKFSPMLEGLFGIILNNWPTIEPMLMQLVTVLSDGLAESMPVILELGQTLLPVLIDVLGSLFQAATPLISVFSSLAATVLPPVASIIGLLAETVIPPLVDILDTLNTSIITPLVPVVQRIAEALLPPIGQLLGAISPILQAISPVLSVIGDVLGTIADVLGSVVGWLADGVGAVANFFAGLFGGAKESEAAVNDLNGAVNGLDETTSKETSLVVDTNDYKNKVEGAANAASDAVTESSNAAKEITDVNFIAMGASATATYGTMQSDAETAWGVMTTAAETGAQRIVAAFEKIAAAGKEASSAANIQVGTNIPHNARGTDNFPGGPTYMNEEGGELAVLPGGSAIIPADQTDRLMSSFSSNVTNENSKSMTFSPKIEIKVEGGGDPNATAEAVEARIRAMFDELYAEAQERDYTDRAMQQGYA